MAFFPAETLLDEVTNAVSPGEGKAGQRRSRSMFTAPTATTRPAKNPFTLLV